MTILTRTSEYALQTLIYLASRADGPPVLAREVADYLGAPAPYLANLLKGFVKRGVVTSTRGRGGGFRIRSAALDRSVLSVVELIEGPGLYTGCVLGLKECADATACPLHYQWKPLREQMLTVFRAHTLRSIGQEVRSGRYRLVLPPGKPGARRRRR